MENDNILLSHTCYPANWHAHNKKCSIKTRVKWSMMNDWTPTIYTYSCQFFAHSLIEFYFYAFYSSLSLKHAVVWRAKREKYNHGALWLITDLHNSWWISIDDLWISVIELWASIIGFMEIELWSSISFDLWRSITHNSIHGALQFAVMELQTIWGDPSSTWRSSIIYMLWSSMIEISTEFHNKLGSSIIMIFVFSGTLCDYGKVKRTKAYRLLNHVAFDCKK